MASLVIERDELVVRLSQLEQLAAQRGDVHVPLGSVTQIRTEKCPYELLRGLCRPGTGVPRRLAYGVRLWTGDRPDFAALHGPGPAVRVDLSNAAPFGRLLVTVTDPGTAVATLEQGVKQARAD